MMTMILRKRILSWCLAALAGLLLTGATTVVVVVQPAASAPVLPTLDLEETFEASGYDLTWDVSNVGNSDFDPDYAVDPISGSKSLEVVADGASGLILKTFTAHADGARTYAAFEFRYVTDGGGGDCFYIYDGNSPCLRVAVLSTNALTIIHGTKQVNGSTALTVGTDYVVWVDWTTADGGSNGTANLYVAAKQAGTTTKPASPESAITEGSNDLPGADTIRIYASTGDDWIFDNIRVADEAIGDWP